MVKCGIGKEQQSWRIMFCCGMAVLDGKLRTVRFRQSWGVSYGIMGFGYLILIVEYGWYLTFVESSNGRTTVLGIVYLGSNPSSTAKD